MAPHILDNLVEVGFRFELKRMAGEPLSQSDRDFAYKVYQEADALGLSNGMKNRLIQEGEEQARKHKI